MFSVFSRLLRRQSLVHTSLAVISAKRCLIYISFHKWQIVSHFIKILEINCRQQYWCHNDLRTDMVYSTKCYCTLRTLKSIVENSHFTHHPILKGALLEKKWVASNETEISLIFGFYNVFKMRDCNLVILSNLAFYPITTF